MKSLFIDGISRSGKGELIKSLLSSGLIDEATPVIGSNSEFLSRISRRSDELFVNTLNLLSRNETLKDKSIIDRSQIGDLAYFTMKYIFKNSDVNYMRYICSDNERILESIIVEKMVHFIKEFLSNKYSDSIFIYLDEPMYPSDQYFDVLESTEDKLYFHYMSNSQYFEGVLSDKRDMIKLINNFYTIIYKEYMRFVKCKYLWFTSDIRDIKEETYREKVGIINETLRY